MSATAAAATDGRRKSRFVVRFGRSGPSAAEPAGPPRFTIEIHDSKQRGPARTRCARHPRPNTGHRRYMEHSKNFSRTPDTGRCGLVRSPRPWIDSQSARATLGQGTRRFCGRKGDMMAARKAKPKSKPARKAARARKPAPRAAAKKAAARRTAARKPARKQAAPRLPPRWSAVAKSEFDAIQARVKALSAGLKRSDFGDDGNARPGPWAALLADLHAWAKTHKVTLETHEHDHGIAAGGAPRAYGGDCPGSFKKTEKRTYYGTTYVYNYTCTLRRQTWLGRCVYDCALQYEQA